MRRDANPGARRLAVPLRRIVARLAVVACPPGPRGRRFVLLDEYMNAL